MPMSGATRMLRARRKDCNVKPNRRLDRKSSRGMLFENEELRMRTITINAEVEQGQHALKKLKRENEQLRREMWSLRDEYDKMEKLLRKNEEDEDSDQENSESDDDLSKADTSDEEKSGAKPAVGGDETPDLDNEENHDKSSKFGNDMNVRTFDGLSVIDEQTEETQTTESAAGCGTSSRGNSVTRTLGLPVQLYDEACAVTEFPQFTYDPDAYATTTHPRKKAPILYAWNARGDTYESRPASPYPCNGSLQDSYQKRYQVLQNLPLVTPVSSNAIGDNGWIFPHSSKIREMPDYDHCYLSSKGIRPEPGAAFPPPKLDYPLIQDRTGPDVFITDGFPQPINEQTNSESILTPKEKLMERDERMIGTVEAEIERLEIGEKSERDPKSQKMTSLTKSTVSRNGARSTETQEAFVSGKLTIDEAADKNDNEVPNHVQQLVCCQNSSDQDVGETFENAPEAESKISLANEMPQSEKPAGSKYRSKLTVTLKAPTVKPELKISAKSPGLAAPKSSFQQPFRYGIKPEYSMRFQTFPSSGYHHHPSVRTPVINGRECLVNHYAGVRTHPNGLSESMPRLPGLLPRTEIGASHIPLEHFDEESGVLPNEESPPGSRGQPSAKPVKIPPVPPPRTSSCPKAIIPACSSGVDATTQNTPRKGKFLQRENSAEQMKEFAIYNPLLLSHPMATSSPTISIRGTQQISNNSSENLYVPKFQKLGFHDESSFEEVSGRRSKKSEESSQKNAPKLNKSLSSPSFGSFRTLRRKPSNALTSSVENIFGQKIAEGATFSEKKKISKSHGQNNVSVSSSSGLDSPTKNDHRKRRVSVQFKKKQSQTDGRHMYEENRGKESTDSRRSSIGQGIATAKGSDRRKGKGKNDETDATTSERERTNSVSSRTSSLAAGSTRRKFSISSNRTYFNDEKIPWCGCWGNGCV